MGQDFLVKITNPERAKAFRDTMGSDEVFVMTPVPEVAILPGLGERKVFKLDLAMYTRQEKKRLAEYVSEKWKLPIAVVEEELGEHGLPILDEDCTVVVRNHLRWI